MRTFILGAALAIFAASAAGLTEAYRAQLEGPNGTENGQMVLTSGQLVFISGDRSFAVPFADVVALHAQNGALEIATVHSDRTLRVLDVHRPDLIALSIGLPIDPNR